VLAEKRQTIAIEAKKKREKGRLNKRERERERKRGKTGVIYDCTERKRDEGTRKGERERELASQFENRRQPERMRVVIIRVPVKSPPFSFLGALPFSCCLVFLSLSLSLFFFSRARDALCFSVFRIFPDSRDIYFVRCGVPRSFSRMRKRSYDAYRSTSTLTSSSSSSSSCDKRKKKERRAFVRVTRQSSLASLLIEASTFNEFIKHRKAAAPCIKKGDYDRKRKQPRNIFFIAPIQTEKGGAFLICLNRHASASLIELRDIYASFRYQLTINYRESW